MSDAKKIDWEAAYERLRLSEQRLAEVLSPDPDRIRRIQAERAARIASRPQRGTREATVPMLIVDLGGERLAIDARTASEVVRISTLTPVAGAAEEVLGVINVRGELYSVLDLHAFLRSKRTEMEIAWGIALRHSSLRIVLGVQAVLRIESVPASAVAALEDNVLRIHDEIAIVLDTQVILGRLEAELASSLHSQDQ